MILATGASSTYPASVRLKREKVNRVNKSRKNWQMFCLHWKEMQRWAKTWLFSPFFFVLFFIFVFLPTPKANMILWVWRCQCHHYPIVARGGPNLQLEECIIISCHHLHLPPPLSFLIISTTKIHFSPGVVRASILTVEVKRLTHPHQISFALLSFLEHSYHWKAHLNKDSSYLISLNFRMKLSTFNHEHSLQMYPFGLWCRAKT